MMLMLSVCLCKDGIGQELANIRVEPKSGLEACVGDLVSAHLSGITLWQTRRSCRSVGLYDVAHCEVDDGNLRAYGRR
jgi:hypothetical protein